MKRRFFNRETNALALIEPSAGNADEQEEDAEGKADSADQGMAQHGHGEQADAADDLPTTCINLCLMESMEKLERILAFKHIPYVGGVSRLISRGRLPVPPSIVSLPSYS
jgi:hypothetical protein